MDLKQLGKYEIIAKIGQGAMGEVFRARDPVLGREVAIKTMSAAVDSDEELRKRFKVEAQSAGRLNHPNIITVYDFGEDQGVAFIAMELLVGKDLRSVIGDRSVTLDEKLHFMEQIADGLAFAHAMGIVHRDLKPANIHVLPSGKVKIMDFGLARLGSSEMTKTGMVMGTPNYMSPEQVRGEKVDVRSDIFSIGAVFYELLTVRKPFHADSMHAVLFQVLESDPEPPLRWVPTLPTILVDLVEMALRKDPAQRFANGGDLLEAVLDARQSISPELLATALPLMDMAGETITSDGIGGPAVPLGFETGVTAAKKSRWTSIRPRSSNAASDPGSRAMANQAALSKTMLGGAPTRMDPGPAPAMHRRPAPAAASGVPAWTYVAGLGLVAVGGGLGWFLTHRTPSLPVEPIRPPVSLVEASPSLPPRQVATPEPSPVEAHVAPSTLAATDKPKPVRPTPEPRNTRASVAPPALATPTPGPVYVPPPTTAPMPPPPTTVPVTAPPPTLAPATVPTPPPTTAPPTTTLAPVNDEPAIRKVVADYGRAIEEKDLQLFKAVKPNTTPDEERRLREAFQGPKSPVHITVLNVQITGAQATVRLTRQDVIDGKVQSFQQTLQLIKGGGVWTIREIGR